MTGKLPAGPGDGDGHRPPPKNEAATEGRRDLVCQRDDTTAVATTVESSVIEAAAALRAKHTVSAIRTITVRTTELSVSVAAAALPRRRALGASSVSRNMVPLPVGRFFCRTALVRSCLLDIAIAGLGFEIVQFIVNTRLD
jgi:hypothetical protein